MTLDVLGVPVRRGLSLELESRFYHQRHEGLKPTVLQAAGIRLRAARLAAGYISGDDFLELKPLMEAALWTLVELGQQKLLPTKLWDVASALQVPTGYLEGTTDYFGNSLPRNHDGISLPPWMKLNDNELVTNAGLLRPVVRGLTMEEVAAMMPGTTPSTVTTMLTGRAVQEEDETSGLQRKSATTQPVPTRLQMECLRYFMLKTHKADPALCLPFLGDDLPKARKWLKLQHEKDAAQAEKADARPSRAKAEPASFLKVCFDRMAQHKKKHGPLPENWKVQLELLMTAVRDGGVEMPRRHGRFLAGVVRGNLNRVLQERRMTLAALLQEVMVQSTVSIILPGEASLMRCLGPRAVLHNGSYVNALAVVAMADILGLPVTELVKLPAL